MVEKTTYEKLAGKIDALEKENSSLRLKQKKTEHLTAVLETMRTVNRMVSERKSRDYLLENFCKSLVHNHGYYNAWITILDESGKMLTTVEAGIGKDILFMVTQLKNGELPLCARKALLQSDIVLINDPYYDCRPCPLSLKYSGRGGLASRLEHDAKVYGFLIVSVPKEFVSNREEHDILKELSGDIAFGLHNLDLQEKQAETENNLQNKTMELNERIKELTCFYSISRLREKTGMSLDDIFQGIVDLIPRAWQYSEITCARIIISGKTFTTGNFKETIWKQSADIIVHDMHLGTLEVCYLKEKPQKYEGPFLTDERNIIDAIAERLGKIIEHKQAEKELIENENRFRTLVENLLIGISIIQNKQIVYQNPEFKRFFGALPPSPRFRDIQDIHPEDIHKAKEFYKKVAFGSPGIIETDFRFFEKDNTDSCRSIMKWVHFRTNRIEYMGMEATLLNMIDITRAKELEHLLGIQDKMTSLGHVAAGIAHEIRNPLSGINIYLNTLQKIYDGKDSDADIKNIFEQILSASGKIEAVIKRVMDFSRPSTPKLVLNDINRFINDAISLSSVTLRKMGITIEKSLDEKLPQTKIDTQLIEQAVLNIITNAAESMKKQQVTKKIHISSSLEHKNIVIKISDSGPGVPDHLKDKIFDPFYTTKNGSTGIGLSLCSRIIIDHGGKITLSNNEWGGATFMLLLPLIEENIDK